MKHAPGPVTPAIRAFAWIFLAGLPLAAPASAAITSASIGATTPNPYLSGYFLDPTRAGDNVATITYAFGCSSPAGCSACAKVDVLPAAGGGPVFTPVPKTLQNGGSHSALWNGTGFGGSAVSDGSYKLRLELYDWQYVGGSPTCTSTLLATAETTSSQLLTVDTVVPVASLATPPAPYFRDGRWVISSILGNNVSPVISGSASDTNFKTYILDYRAGTQTCPATGSGCGNDGGWTNVFASNSPPAGSTLASWNPLPAANFYTLRLRVCDGIPSHTSCATLAVKRSDHAFVPDAQIVDWAGNNSVNKAKFTLTLPFTLTISADFSRVLTGTGSIPRIYLPNGLTEVDPNAVSKTVTWEWDGTIPGGGRIADDAWRYTFNAEAPDVPIRPIGSSAATILRTFHQPWPYDKDFFPAAGEAIRFTQSTASPAWISFVMGDFFLHGDCQPPFSAACANPLEYSSAGFIPVRRELLAKAGGGSVSAEFAWEGTTRSGTRCCNQPTPGSTPFCNSVAIDSDRIGTFYQGGRYDACRELWAYVFRDGISGSYLITQNSTGIPRPEPSAFEANPPMFRLGEPTSGSTPRPLELQFALGNPPNGVDAFAELAIYDPSLPLGSPSPTDPLSNRIVYSADVPITNANRSGGLVTLPWDGTATTPFGSASPFAGIDGTSYLVARVRVRYQTATAVTQSVELYVPFAVGY